MTLRLPHLLQDAVKVMAKSLIRNRHAVTKMYNLKGQLQAVSLRIQVGPMPLWSGVFCKAYCPSVCQRCYLLSDDAKFCQNVHLTILEATPGIGS